MMETEPQVEPPQHCRSLTGEDVVLSQDTAVFGFAPMSIVHFTKSRFNGKVALVRGVSDGMLWFSIFPTIEAAASPSAVHAAVQTTSCRGREEYIRQYGWVVEEDAKVAEGGPPVVHESISDPGVAAQPVASPEP